MAGVAQAKAAWAMLAIYFKVPDTGISPAIVGEIPPHGLLSLDCKMICLIHAELARYSITRLRPFSLAL